MLVRVFHDVILFTRLEKQFQGWSNPIARRPGLVISEVGQVKIYLSLAHGQLDFSSPPVLN